jgi:hypothetical protein
VTNDTKCYDINVTFINRNIKTKINKNTKNKGECTQAHSVHEPKNRKFIHLKENNKIMTNDTKCHFEINIIVTHKNIKIKINLKNNNTIGGCAQVHDTHKMNKNKNTQIIKNKITISNTKYHFKLNVIFMNKNIEIKINKNNNDRDKCVHNAYKIKKRKSTQKTKNEIIINDTKCHFETNNTHINKNKNIEKTK